MGQINRYILGSTASAFALLATPQLATAQEQNDAQQAAEEEIYGDNLIIVTASKRETTLQELPVAVSVTSAETIETAQIRDLIDLQSVVPSLRVTQLQTSGNTNFIIRGFGNGANNPGIEPSVGVFIDGVYRSRSAAQIGDLPNLERVEVLRGSQSTLFGKNASAGIISIVTKKPEFIWSGGGEITYGNYDAFIAKGDITGPITDTVAFSLAGNYNRRDGYIDDLNLNTDFNNRERWGVRGQLLWEATDNLEFRLIGDFDNIDENCCGVANLRAGQTMAVVNAVGGQVDNENPFSYDVYNNKTSDNNIDNYGGSLQIDYEMGPLALTSITAYREVQSDTDQDSDFTSADLIGSYVQSSGIDTFTQELRLASDFDGPLNFLIGGYYFDENIDAGVDLKFGQDFRNYANILIQQGTGGAFGAAGLEA